jgi:hypothetical protein
MKTMNTPGKIHIFPSPSSESSDAIPEDAISVAYVQPLSEEATEAYLAELALSLWLLRQEPQTLAKCA